VILDLRFTITLVKRSPGFYLRNTTSLRKKEKMATYQGMHEYNLYSLRYLCTFSYSKNTSKFTGSLLKIYVCDENKTLLSMKVKYVYGIQNRKYTGGAVQEKKAWNTVQVIPYQFYLNINVISILCNPNGTLFQTCLILHV
jgi:hypothetical protein